METTTQETETGNRPTHVVKVRDGHGRKASYDRIGVAWENLETGGFWVKLHGTQIVSEGFSIYPI